MPTCFDAGKIYAQIVFVDFADICFLDATLKKAKSADEPVKHPDANRYKYPYFLYRY